MKKIFTLFAAAVIGLTGFAQITFVPEATDDASLTKIHIMVQNDRDDLQGVQLGIFLENGAQLTTVFDEDLEENICFVANPLYFLGNFDKTDNWKMKNFRSYADIKDGDNPNGYHLISVTLNGGPNNDAVIIYPKEDGELGYFNMDLSACPDGDEVEVGYMSENPDHSVFATTGGTGISVERANIVVKKEGNKITPTGINVVETIKNVVNVKYYNLQGIESATPFDGVNIMVKTYEDGSKATSKVVK